MATLIYTDGSIRDGKIGWSWLAVEYTPDEPPEYITAMYGRSFHLQESRNITGECDAVMQALTWAYQSQRRDVTIIHDYIGLREWAAGRWSANTKVAEQFCDYVWPLQKKMRIKFVHIKGHAGNHYNHIVDTLAGKATAMTSVTPTVLSALQLKNLYPECPIIQEVEDE